MDRKNTQFETEQAFMHGVEETSDIPVIYVSPKHFASNDPNIQAQSFTAQIEQQVPNVTLALAQRLAQKSNLSATEISEVIEAHADMIKDSSPTALNKIIVGDQEYCLVSKPGPDWDTKAELITKTSGLINPVLEHFPGNDKDWNRAVGYHEGEHCNKQQDAYSDSEQLDEEGRSDRSAIHTLEQRQQSDIALAYKDVRHLGSAIGNDPVHATGVLLSEQGNHNTSHIQIDTSGYYKQFTNGQVISTLLNRNDESYGRDNDINDHFESNPDDYFAIANQELQKGNDHVVNAHEQSPSPTTAFNLVAVQTLTNYAQNYEDAYRRRVLGQNIPEREQTVLISKEEEAQIHIKIQQEKEQEKADQKNTSEGSAQTPTDRVNSFFSNNTDEICPNDIRSSLPSQACSQTPPEIEAMIEVQSSDTHLINVAQDIRDQGNSEFVLEHNERITEEASNDSNYTQDISPEAPAPTTIQEFKLATP